MAVGRAILLTLFSVSLSALPASRADASNTSSPDRVPLRQGRSAPAAPSTEALDPKILPLPAVLEDNVAFWKDIFAEYTSQKAVLHDELHLGIRYAVLDFSPLEASDLSSFEKQRRRGEAVRKTEQHYSSILLALASGTALDDEDHRRVRALLEDLPGGPAKYRLAKDRLRLQTGLKDRFEAAVGRSGRYMAAMEASFAEHGVPTILTRIAFVESMFQEGARSKVGAGGIWQLMPATARSHLTIGPEVDERYDPLVAADTAARILAGNYRSLDSWPLAITAYNHGVNGMRRAVRNLETRDPGIVLTQHQSPSYGFASRNFYAEFLAAAEVYADRRIHFPAVEPAPALRFDVFTPSLYVSILDLASQSGIALTEFQNLNPAFDREIWRGGLLVPKGYRLRVPEGSAHRLAEAYASLPDSRKSPYQAGLQHRVRSGETLGSIARHYGTSVAALQQTNKLRHANLIHIGQTLLIPARPGTYRPPAPEATRLAVAPTQPAAAAEEAPAAETLHVVRAGETLSTLAERYGTSTATLASVNGLANAHSITVGQRLKIPAASAPREPARHTVRSGETLVRIAQIYGTTVTALKNANQLVGHMIYPRQVLVIP